MCRIQYFKKCCILLCLALIVTGCAGCMPRSSKTEVRTPEIPVRFETADGGVPVLKVYDADTEEIEEMDVESYLQGVLAGEMRNDWPMEALKAQAILARTFTMKFVTDKSSKYAGADISTDIHEAQAYDASAVNDRIRSAVEETRGLVMTSEGELTQAWFHAHAGGTTELPVEALEYSMNPDYLRVVDSPDSPKAPEDVKGWTAEFTLEEVLAACSAVGVEADTVESFSIGERGASGRAVSFKLNGRRVSAPSFRLHIGADKLKSTMIDGISLLDDKLIFEGRGFGHGVGLSQWGAYAMAEEGKSAQEIIGQYYNGVELMKLW